MVKLVSLEHRTSVRFWYPPPLPKRKFIVKEVNHTPMQFYQPFAKVEKIFIKETKMRQRYVNRTIRTTTITATICDKSTHEISNKDFILSGKYSMEDVGKIQKAISLFNDQKDFVIIEINSAIENLKPYRCTEDEYLSVAKPIEK